MQSVKINTPIALFFLSMRMRYLSFKEIKPLILRNKEIFKFIVIFISMLVLLFLLFYFMEDSLDFMRTSTADITAFFSNIFGMDAKASGTSLILSTMTFEIIHECTGIFALMIYFSCTIAYPTTWRHKIIGIAIGFPFILAMNLMRMIILVYIAGYHQDIFDYVHSYLWQGTFIIFVILIWFLWIEKVVK